MEKLFPVCAWCWSKGANTAQGKLLSYFGEEFHEKCLDEMLKFRPDLIHPSARFPTKPKLP